MNELKIIQAENGYILESWCEDEDDKITKAFVLVEETENDATCLKNMLLLVAEHFGYMYDKFSSENINITFDKKGHKVE